MSTHATWLDERGAEYIARVQQNQCSFLSEIATPPQELVELFRNLRSVGIFRRDEHWACLAVAAVNAAVIATEEQTSFIELFLERMLCQNKPRWDNQYGPGIEYFLLKYLNHEPDA